MDFFTQLLVSGLSVGFLYGLSAMGFVMIFKSSSVLNFAHGELLALGAYFFLALVTWAKLPILLAFLLTLAGCFLLGILIERIFLRPLIGEPLIFIIMLTVGLAAMFKGLILLIWGGNLYTYPDFLPKVLEINWGVIRLPPVYGATLIIGTIFLLLFGLFFKYSSQGIYMRSVADNQRAALSLGVHVKRVFALSWAIAALVAGMSGLVLGIINGVNVHNLSAIGLKVFPVIILGGARPHRGRHYWRDHHWSPGDLHRGLHLPVAARCRPLHRSGGDSAHQTLRLVWIERDRAGLKI